jgi:hypothetical protein
MATDEAQGKQLPVEDVKRLFEESNIRGGMILGLTKDGDHYMSRVINLYGSELEVLFAMGIFQMAKTIKADPFDLLLHVARNILTLQIEDPKPLVSHSVVVTPEQSNDNKNLRRAL